MDLLEIMQNRRSVRKYSAESVTDEQIEKIVTAALLGPSGHSKYPCEFVVVKDRETLGKMSHCRVGVAKMLNNASCAIIVIADRDKSDTIVEDSSIAMMNMHLMAASIGLGSCWIQLRAREAENGKSSEDFIREIFKIPENYLCQAILSIGNLDKPPKPHDINKLPFDKVLLNTNGKLVKFKE